MTVARYDLRVIDKRVFLSTFSFSLIAGLNLPFSFFLHIFLARNIGTAAWSAISLLWSGLYYVLDPVLYFVVLYVYCRGPLLSRIACVLISITFGSLLGFWTGYLSGALLTAAFLGESAIAVSLNIVLTLPGHAIGQLFTAFAVLALSDVVRKWNDALPREIRSRPGGLIILTILYVVFALLNVLAVPLLGIYAISNAATPIETLVVVLLISVLGLTVIGQLVLAAGLYLGKKWAWILAVVSSVSSALIDISVITAIAVSGADLNAGLTLMISGLFIAFLVSSTISAYLMSASIRQFFGFVNPTEQMQVAFTASEF